MIDLRSDTFTKPTPEMRRAMAEAEVGDDVFGEDPTVNRLQEAVAEMTGMEAALFVPSGSMGNQIGIRLHCGPGDEFLCEQDAHVFQYEQASFAQLFGICAQIVPGDGGMLTPELLAPRVRPDNEHAPVTRLVCLENTHNRHGGRVLLLGDVEATCQWAHDMGLATHLDGARLWNACVATGTSPADWCRHFDTTSVCFSKGLGAPIGSAVAGPARLIHKQARRLRKAMGGGMRQVGVIAAAALYALEHHYDRLADDHAHARLLAAAVREAPGLTLVEDRCDTNIVMFTVDPAAGTAADFCERLREQGVLMLAVGPQKVRAVTHLDVSADEARRAAEALAAVAPAAHA